MLESLPCSHHHEGETSPRQSTTHVMQCVCIEHHFTGNKNERIEPLSHTACAIKGQLERPINGYDKLLNISQVCRDAGLYNKIRILMTVSTTDALQSWKTLAMFEISSQCGWCNASKFLLLIILVIIFIIDSIPRRIRRNITPDDLQSWQAFLLDKVLRWLVSVARKKDLMRLG